MQNLLPLRMLPLLSAAILIVLRADAERMRQSFERRLRRAEALAQDADGTELAACTKLLRESVDLLSEGRSLALEIGAKHDAVSTLQK